MQIKASTAAVAFNFVNFTSHLDKDGNPVVRTTYPTKHYSGFVSLREKLLKLVIVTSKKDGGTEELSLDEFGKCDPKPEVVSERFTNGEVELTDGEKKALKAAVSAREELPIMDDETIAQLNELAGTEVGK